MELWYHITNTPLEPFIIDLLLLLLIAILIISIVITII